MNLLLGVDPGFSGALAWYNANTKRLVKVIPMPLAEIGSTVFGPANQRREIDTPALARMIAATHEDTLLAVVEQVGASPQMGVTSSFRFGQGFGILQGVLAAHAVNTRYTQPAVWKAGLQLSARKQESLAMACKLFPEWSPTFQRDARSADLAEAALLAYFGQRFLPQKTS